MRKDAIWPMNDVRDRNRILDRLRILVSLHLGIDSSRLQSSAAIEDVGIDSFQLIELVFLVEDEFGIAVDLTGINVKTVDDVVSLVQERLHPK
jgi:acyl carrier protein